MNQVSRIESQPFEPVIHKIDGCDTIPKLFLEKVKQRGDRIAMREKDFGLWQTFSWNDFHDRAMRIAHGLLKLGLQKGDVVSILSDDCKEWVWADMGIMLAGGTVNGIYPTYQPDQLGYVLNDSRTRFLFVENEEQLDKYITVRSEVPEVEAVYFFDDKGLRTFRDDRIQPIEHLYEEGKLAWGANEALVEEIAARSDPEDLAILCYTSGTTGKPKGAMIPQRALIYQMTLAPEYFKVTQDDELLTYLPLCHVAERVFSLCMHQATGAVINFAESPESVPKNLQELSPTVIFGVPRIWEKSYSRINTLMSEATWIGRKTYQAAMSVGMRRAEKLIAGRDLSFWDKVAFAAVDRLVFHNIKQLIGLDRATFLASGAAPISESLLKWYLSLGLSITEAYGQTETSGLATLTRAGQYKPGSVGPAVPGSEVRLADNGEILIRTDGAFKGYLNQPEKSAETIVNGWIHTGDVGHLDEDGNLSITDRIKDIIITAGGKNITPSQIENELKFSPYISDSVVIGDRRKYLTVLIMIDKENVEHYAQTNAIPFTDYRSLCARPEVVELIRAEIEAVNRNFSPVEQLKKFRLIDVLLTAEDEELTPTMKLKRSFVSEKYSALINDMYSA
ncbi:AMP-dependent synthetase/ligase [Lutimaribacter marinistellae]|uniref:AMP-dependent synthetase/ligase n=1 Tax=Lutimaribacter marinistellae TaxID=1820329 RepID=A0ABV7TB93_9RHOB